MATVERWTTGGAETMGILSATDRADDAWEFLKWWSSAEVQAEFGNTLIETFGSEYIWPTANIEAFAQLPLASAHKQVIIEQMQWMTEAPWILGTYMLERELSNAYIYPSWWTAPRPAARWIPPSSASTGKPTRKLEEFGYIRKRRDGRGTENADRVDVVETLYRRLYKESLGEEGEAGLITRRKPPISSWRRT